MLSPLGASIAGIVLALGGTAAAAYSGSSASPSPCLPEREARRWWVGAHDHGPARSNH